MRTVIVTVIILMESFAPFLLGFEIGEVLRVEETHRVGSIIGRPVWLEHWVTSWNEQRISRAWFDRRMPSGSAVNTSLFQNVNLESNSMRRLLAVPPPNPPPPTPPPPKPVLTVVGCRNCGEVITP